MICFSVFWKEQVVGEHPGLRRSFWDEPGRDDVAAGNIDEQVGEGLAAVDRVRFLIVHASQDGATSTGVSRVAGASGMSATPPSSRLRSKSRRRPSCRSGSPRPVRVNDPGNAGTRCSSRSGFPVRGNDRLGLPDRDEQIHLVLLESQR